MTVDQTRVLGFESPTTDWSSNNGSTVSASTVASEGSGSLSVLPNGYTQISSIAIAAPGSAAATATFDLKVPQAVPWGEVRLIVKAPSQGHYWSDLGGKQLAQLAPGDFRSVSFPLPQGVQNALNSNASDLTFMIVLNSPSGIGAFLIDNLDVGGDSQPPVPSGPKVFSMVAPCDTDLAAVLVSGTERLVVDDRSTLGAPGQLAVVAVGDGGLEFGAGVQAKVDVFSVGEMDLLRSQAHVFGRITAAGTVVKQDGSVVVDGSVLEGSSTPVTSTSWSLAWPENSAGNLSLPPDSPNLAVSPGTYGVIHAYSRATLTLTSGSYFVDSLVLEPEVHFRVNANSGPVR